MKPSLFATLSLPFIIIISFLLPNPSLSERCNPNDKKLLLQIKKELNNPNDFINWDPKTDCCTDWFPSTVQCDDATNRVVSLGIFRSKLSGQIPAAVGDLSELEYLYFDHVPNLTGPIPQAISKLSKLKYLMLTWTNLSGPVPTYLGKMKNLTYINLSFNNLTGEIPPSLSELPYLDYLRLDRNKLTGKIPESFGKFVGKVPSLLLSHNRLTGELPRSLGDLDYDTVDLSRNLLEGDASHLFSNNKTTWKIDLSRNMFKFDLSKVEFPVTLERLDLNHNQIYGSLPATLTGLELQLLNMSYNRLCGKIPQSGDLQGFDLYSYFHNKCLCDSPLALCK